MMRRLFNPLRTIATLLLAVLVAVVAIVAYNAVNLRSRQVTVAPLAPPPAGSPRRFASRLCPTLPRPTRTPTRS